MTDQEINQLEIEFSLREFLQKETHEETFFEWMMEIDFDRNDREFDDYHCRQMELSQASRVRRLRHSPTRAISNFPYLSDTWDIHSEDPDWDPRDEPMFDNRMYPDDDDFDFYPWEDHQMLLSMEVFELSHCPEQDLVRSITLRGLPQRVRHELIREYCVI